MSYKKDTFPDRLCFLLPEDGPIQIAVSGVDGPSSLIDGDCDFLVMTYNRALDRTVNGEVSIYFRDRFLKDGSKPNAVIAQIVGPEAAKHFRGPISIGAFIDSGHEQRGVPALDLRHFVDYIYFYTTVVIPSGFSWEGFRNHAELVICDGYMKRFNRPRYENINIRQNDGKTLNSHNNWVLISPEKTRDSLGRQPEQL